MADRPLSAARRGYDHRWRTVRLEVLERDRHTCQLCGAPASHVDHVVPISAGGARLDPANLRALCRACNVARANRGRARVLDTPPSRRW